MNKKSPEAALVLCSLGCSSRICIGAIKCWSTKKKNALPILLHHPKINPFKFSSWECPSNQFERLTGFVHFNNGGKARKGWTRRACLFFSSLKYFVLLDSVHRAWLSVTETPLQNHHCITGKVWPKLKKFALSVVFPTPNICLETVSCQFINGVGSERLLIEKLRESKVVVSA
jgi:hypothetical protein